MTEADTAAITPLALPGNIRNYSASDKCIGISNGLAGDWYCTSNPDQTWHWGAANADGWREIVNGYGKCLAVNGASTQAGAQILGYDCVHSADQYWLPISGTANLVNYKGWFDPNATGWVVGVTGGSTANGAALVLWWYDGTPNQFWIY